MKFRTEISLEPYDKRISYQKPVLLMGSCFTEHIGNRLKRYLFHACVNPFGVTYNPASLAQNIDKLIDKDHYTGSDLAFENEVWFSFDHYTKFSDPEKNLALEKINVQFLEAKQKLKNASHLLLTFGTAFTYMLRESSQTVNNCHKLPASRFERRLLSVKEIVAAYEKLLTRLKLINPKLQVLFTISPVRHLKDNLTGNQLSKATLLLAVHELAKKYGEFCHYFPSYEIMMDDLRDYRYYASDMLHPNNQAVDYIWELFCDSSIDQDSLNILREIEPLLLSLEHRPLHTTTGSYHKFKLGLMKKIDDLRQTHPHLNWENIRQE